MFDDYIFRETAIIRLTGMFLDNSKDYREACKAIEKISAADVRENVKGQWLDYRDNPIKFYFDGRYSAHCSVCGYHPEYEEEMRSANFCPNCGADMRGEWKD